VTDGRTDRQTDGIAVARTALAMRALRRVVKTSQRGEKSCYRALFGNKIFDLLAYF